MNYVINRSHSPTVERRITTVQVVIFLLFLTIIYRLFVIQVLQRDIYRTAAARQQQIATELTARRGEIYAWDRTNTSARELYPLAINKIFYEVYVNPSEITRPQNTADALAQALKIESREILPRIEKAGDTYEPIKRKVTEQELAVVQKIALPGIYWRQEYWRYYPDGVIGSHLIGFYGFEGATRVGKYGIEGYWEPELSGSHAAVPLERDAAGNIIPDSAAWEQVTDGADIILTIDRTIQFEACSALERSVGTTGAESGTVVILESETGKILGLCSSPTFDPNSYEAVADISYFNNSAIFESYEPGSVFKAIAMAIAIDDERVTPRTVYEDTGEAKIADFTIKNSDKKAHGIRTMTQVLEESLNTGIIFATQNVDNRVFADYVDDFGFGDLTGIELTKEVAGDIRSLERYADIYKATASFGQGISVTPLQLVTGFNVLANQGKLLRPYMVAEIRSPSGSIETTEPSVRRQVIRPETAQTVGAMLVNAVENGHATRASVPGYYIAGKTGTAQVAEGGEYGSQTIHTFVGFAPVSQPKFTMLTKLNNPERGGFAESTAAPLFGEIASFLLQYYQLPPER